MKKMLLDAGCDLVYLSMAAATGASVHGIDAASVYWLSAKKGSLMPLY
jgi:hypothetical protein